MALVTPLGQPDAFRFLGVEAHRRLYAS
jgi:hypothetical protein